MTRRLVLAWLAAVLALPACQSPQARTLAAPLEFHGTVLWAPSRHPMENVTVELRRVKPGFPFARPPQLLATARTDSRGRFRFRTSSRGPYDILCFRPGPHAGSGALDVRPSTPIVVLYRPDPLPHP